MIEKTDNSLFLGSHIYYAVILGKRLLSQDNINNSRSQENKRN